MPTRTKYDRQAKTSRTMASDKGEKARTSNNEGNSSVVMMGQMLAQITSANEASLKLLTEKLEALQLAQIKNIESQKATVKTPLPKYSGKAGEFDDWKQGVLMCIKMNDWTDEKRIIDMLTIFSQETL